MLPQQTNSTFSMLKHPSFPDFSLLWLALFRLILAYLGVFFASNCVKICVKWSFKIGFTHWPIFSAFGWCTWQNVLKKYMDLHSPFPLFKPFSSPSWQAPPASNRFPSPLVPPAPWPASPSLPSHHPALNVCKCSG